MQIEDHVLTLHLRKDGVEGSIVDDAGARVGGHAGWVALDTGDTALLGLADGLGSDGLVQVQRHEVVDIGFEGLEALLVIQSAVDGRDGRDQVGLYKSYII